MLNWSKACRKPRLRLICFPFAGGNANTYRSWVDRLPADIELLAIQLPGRGGRFNEPSVTELPTLIEHITKALEPLIQMPSVFFGHSMGAIVAYEICTTLKQSNKKQPALLVLSACSAPDSKQQSTALHTLPSKLFWEEVQIINGTSSEVLDNPELLELLEPSLRADFKIVYDWRQLNTQPEADKLSVPIVLFGGKNDDSVSLEQLQMWQKYTSKIGQTYLFSGDHFFIQDPTPSFFSTLSGLLAPIG
ncbi:MAG: alpha/beta fold hydrolase [Gammaproteobacteria bacterium]|nr:alpha/beta fold hydrolase [Gammaproteobacteria bacterium]